MNVFDSIKDNNWNGRGVKILKNSMIILKSAKLSHKLNLQSGSYSIKIIGRKRSGNGKVSMSVGDSFAKDISFSTSTWSEYAFEFDVFERKLTDVILSRSGTAFGSVEIGRLIIERIKSENKTPKKSYTAPQFIKNDKSGNIFKNTVDESFRSKVAFVVPYSIYGGAEVYIQEMINNFDTNKVKITMLYMRSNIIKHKITAKVNHNLIKSKEYMEGLLLSEGFDYIVYYNSSSVYKILSNLKLIKRIESKLIEVYHSDFKWADALSNYKRRDGVDQIISVSNSLGKDIGNVSANETIPVGINLNRFKKREGLELRKSLSLKSNGRVIGTVARLSTEKNLDYIISLARQMPNDTFLIIGEGPERNNLLKKAPSNLRLVGFQSEIESYYNIFDIFVLPSKIEGTPISILEAMSSGLPVYSSEVGGVPDIISHGETGWFLTMDLAKDVKLINDTCSKEEIGLSARKYIEKYHDVTKNAKTFLNLFLNNGILFEDIEPGRVRLSGEYI